MMLAAWWFFLRPHAQMEPIEIDPDALMTHPIRYSLDRDIPLVMALMLWAAMKPAELIARRLHLIA